MLAGHCFHCQVAGFVGVVLSLHTHWHGRVHKQVTSCKRGAALLSLACQLIASVQWHV